MICMYKIAVLGDRDSVYGFAAVGLDTFFASEPEYAAKKLRELAGGDYAVIYVTESLWAGLDHEIERYRQQPLPAILPIPGASGNTGIGITQVRRSVEQAVGSDIIFGGDA
ncbi:V-type sodium pump subunit G [Anaerotruncus sp. 2789STDY5834896]|uniref:V-type sodium pump subunit G n=1 Tax=uncultured Anaerotruncus sp. TaxID=905011 RepID=A0A1C6JCL9_9FIRM|nr:V-type sodium pump subunit G [uncultured Anaerotruncus sp.]